MKRRYLVLISLCMLTSCAQKSNENITQTTQIEEEISEELRESDLRALDIVKEYFAEETENRIFEVLEPITKDNRECVQIRVSGIYANGKYPIDTFLIDHDSENHYFYNKTDDEFVMYAATPCFACKTSPDGSLRIESVGMYMDGPSGLHSLSTMRIIDTETAEYKWVSSSMLNNSFLWSDTGRFVSYVRYTRISAEAGIIDTEDFSVTESPIIEDIINLCDEEIYPPNEERPDSYFVPEEWISETEIKINFSWSTDIYTEVSGRYIYDMTKKEINDIEIIENGAEN